MLEEVLFALWFFLPAGVANMAPILAAKMPLLREWEAPLDFGRTFRGKRVFGSHKTWRGLVAGIIAAMLVLWLQQYLVREHGWLASQAAAVDYTALPVVWLGLAFAVGALGGDAVKSFLKRQHNIGSGKAWLPYDIIDHIIGAMVLSAPFVLFAWWIYPVVFVIWAGANFGISYASYKAGIKARPI
jgi:CDP-2,3-bis-(O-geranylgeranyl)-sn-glycerol synthase